MEIPRVNVQDEKPTIPADYQGAEVGVSWTAMHDSDAFDVFVPGTFVMSPEAVAEQNAAIQRAAEEAGSTGPAI